MVVDRAFVEDYYDLAGDVSRASHESFTDRLNAWLAFLDEHAEAAAVAAALAPDFDIAAWYTAAMASADDIGRGTLSWSTNRREKLGQILALYRHFAATPDEVLQFALAFYSAGPRFDDNVRKVNQELFDPLSRDLIKEIERASAAAATPASVPASDRVVRLDHNSADFQQLATHLAAIEEAVPQSNELANDVEERDQALAEVGAGRALLRAVRVRSSAIKTTLLPALRWIGDKAGSAAIQIAVAAALTLIASLFGYEILKI